MATPADQYHQPHSQPPQQQQQQQQHSQRRQQRPQQQSQSSQQHYSHAKPRSFSFRSDRSHHSGAGAGGGGSGGGSGGHKAESHETHEEKESRRLHSKADPSLAINEAEPSAVAAMMTQSLVPLRSIQHKDNWGNPIADPDKSNPTRNRWERPLETIRSFEAAIDGGYSRKSLYRSDTDSVANWTRRSSFMPQTQPRFPQDSYYGSRPASFRADSQYGHLTPGAARNSYFDSHGHGGGGYGNGNGNGQSRSAQRERSHRMHSEPHYQTYGREQTVYPMPHKDRSYETVTSAVPSGNSDPAGYQTDPTSSDNSSIDRALPAKRREPVNDYGIGFSQSQTYQAPEFSVAVAPNSSNHPLPQPPPEAAQYNSEPAPTIPRKQPSVLKRQTSQQQTDTSDKRKSWFTRRFSKNA